MEVPAFPELSLSSNIADFVVQEWHIAVVGDSEQPISRLQSWHFCLYTLKVKVSTQSPGAQGPLLSIIIMLIDVGQYVLGDTCDDLMKGFILSTFLA